MNAVDTNVLVRLLTADEAKQTAAARSLFASGPIWIAKTVLLETAWVLRSLYKFEASAIHAAIIRLLGLPNIMAEDEQSIAAALSLTERGMDFADALHLTSSPPGSIFVSFDKALIRQARRGGVPAVAELSSTRIRR